jgi:hypothetical protein
MPEIQSMNTRRVLAVVARLIVVAAASLYGVAVTGGAVVACGGGHGTYVVLGIVSAPLGFCGVWSAIVFAPLLWVSLFFVASGPARHNRLIATAALLTHYLAATVLITRSEFGDWTDFQAVYGSVPRIIIEPLAIYIAGQLALWLMMAFPALRCQRLKAQFSVKSALIATALFAVALRSGFAQDVFRFVWWYAEIVMHFE